MAFLPFAATIGTALGTTATGGGMAIASTAATIAASAVTIASATRSQKGLSAVPKVDTSAIPEIQPEKTLLAEEKDKIKRGASNRKQTLLTGPQGLLDAAPVGKKYLLGE